MLLGYLGLLTGAAILSYYGVVAGWTLGYLYHGFRGNLSQGDPGEFFGAFVADWKQQVLYLALFMGLTMAVVGGGVRQGIERISKVLMPLLLLMLLGLIVNALMQPQAMAGLRYYLMPDFSQVTTMTFVYALGQAFFSLSLGMGAMLTYGSYMSRKEDLAKAGIYVVLFDTAIALMAGLIIFPVLGGAPRGGGPGLVFVVLIQQFRSMPAGWLVGQIFFLLLAVAALTSTVSLLEVVVSYLVDELKLKRIVAVLLSGVGILLVGVPSALSLGAVPGFSELMTIGGKPAGFLDVMNYLFGNLSLTVGALLLCLFVVLRWKPANAVAEIVSSAPWFRSLAKPWIVCVAVLCPLAVFGLLAYMLVTGQGLG